MEQTQQEEEKKQQSISVPGIGGGFPGLGIPGSRLAVQAGKLIVSTAIRAGPVTWVVLGVTALISGITAAIMLLAGGD